jgi:biotin carboxylase
MNTNQDADACCACEDTMNDEQIAFNENIAYVEELIKNKRFVDADTVLTETARSVEMTEERSKLVKELAAKIERGFTDICANSGD